MPRHRRKVVGRPRFGDNLLDHRHSVKFDGQLKKLLDQRAAETGMSLSEQFRRAIEKEVAGELPLLGTIPCGPLQEAVQQAEKLLSVGNTLKWLPGDFLLEAEGDSMMSLIMPGDLVLLRPEVDWKGGEVCAVQVFDSKDDHHAAQATLKRITHTTGSDFVTLRALNSAYPAQKVAADLIKVIGVYRGLVRPA